MKKPKIKVNLTKEDEGYSANTLVNANFIATEGENLEELKANILEAVNFTFETEGLVYSIEELQFV